MTQYDDTQALRFLLRSVAPDEGSRHTPDGSPIASIEDSVVGTITITRCRTSADGVAMWTLGDGSRIQEGPHGRAVYRPPDYRVDRDPCMAERLQERLGWVGRFSGEFGDGEPPDGVNWIDVPHPTGGRFVFDHAAKPVAPAQRHAAELRKHEEVVSAEAQPDGSVLVTVRERECPVSLRFGSEVGEFSIDDALALAAPLDGARGPARFGLTEDEIRERNAQRDEFIVRADPSTERMIDAVDRARERIEAAVPHPDAYFGRGTEPNEEALAWLAVQRRYNRDFAAKQRAILERMGIPDDIPLALEGRAVLTASGLECRFGDLRVSVSVGADGFGVEASEDGSEARRLRVWPDDWPVVMQYARKVEP